MMTTMRKDATMKIVGCSHGLGYCKECPDYDECLSGEKETHGLSDYGVSPSDESATNGEVGASDYTLDDAMRDLEYSRLNDMGWKRDQAHNRLAAYIERLEAEVAKWKAAFDGAVGYHGEGMASTSFPVTFDGDIAAECVDSHDMSNDAGQSAHIERLEAEKAELHRECNARYDHQCELLEQRDEWEAVAMRLASWLVAYRHDLPPAFAVTWSEVHDEFARRLMRLAQKAVRHE